MSAFSSNFTVHVVDDDDSLRLAVSRLLRAAGYEVLAYASSGEFLLSHQPGLRGCLLLDVRMPGPNGMDLHDALQRQGSSLPVIFLTGHGDIPMSVRAMKAGAVDFLIKPVKRENLLRAVKSALARESEAFANSELLQACRRNFATLTEREREVFVRVAEGHLNKNIAADLGTAERTVKAHRAQVMRKMQAASIADLVRAADLLKTAP